MSGTDIRVYGGICYAMTSTDIRVYGGIRNAMPSTDIRVYGGIRYAMPSTDIRVYGGTRRSVSTTRYGPMLLRGCYAMSGTEIAYGCVSLRRSYGISGTERAYGGTSACKRSSYQLRVCRTSCPDCMREYEPCEPYKEVSIGPVLTGREDNEVGTSAGSDLYHDGTKKIVRG
eukprot:2995042-Rhodomonas_salina.1